MDSASKKVAFEVSLDKVKKERNAIKLFESETGVSRTYRTGDLVTRGKSIAEPRYCAS
jgi:hypothetical protein